MTSTEIIPCSRCDAATTFERNAEGEPHEGEHCDTCGGWFCRECMDWREPSDALYCVTCSPNN